MAETRTLVTADDLLRLPDTGRHYELVAGELIEMVPPGGEHGYVAAGFVGELRAFVRQAGTGGGVFSSETGFRLRKGPETVRVPDAAYVAAARLALARVPGYPDLAPDLVVEVVSPYDTASAVQTKVEEWLDAGTQMVVLAHPATRSATVYRSDGSAIVLRADDILMLEPVLPGFASRLGDFFQ